MDLEKAKLTVAQIGPYPPPYGGVSVHVQRLQRLLLNNDIPCTVYDYEPVIKNIRNVINIRRIKNWVALSNNNMNIIHIHISALGHLKWVFILSLLFKIKRKEVIITFHSLTNDVKHFNWARRILFNLSNRFVSVYIAVSPRIKDRLISLNVMSNKILTIPAFLPPVIKQHEVDEIPQDIWDFTATHKPIISANAYKITFHNKQDLYGIDLCIDLCANLKNAFPRIGFVFCLPYVEDYLYFSKMKQRIMEKEIKDNFIFVTKPYQFYPIIMKSDIFVRPTNTDGDAISLREALNFKVPSVASNAVSRAEGTILFKNRDIGDLTLVINDVLTNYGVYKKKLNSVNPGEYFCEIMDVYKMLTKHKC